MSWPDTLAVAGRGAASKPCGRPARQFRSGRASFGETTSTTPRFDRQDGWASVSVQQ